VLLSAVLAVALTVMPGLATLVVRAADTPDGAVNAVLDTFISKQFDLLGPLVCEEKREEIIAEFDLRSLFGGEGVDAQPLVDAMTLSIDDRSVGVLSEDGDTASVQIGGTLRMVIDDAAARAWAKATLEAIGQPADDASIEAYMGFFTLMVEGTPIDATVEVVRTDGQWLMCDDLESGEPEESYDPNATAPPAVNPLCGLMTVEELNTLSPLVFALVTPTDGGCTYDPDYEATGSFYSVSIYLQEGELSFLKEVWPDGQDLTIAGKEAWGTETATWVDIGDGIIAIQPVIFASGDDEQVDVIALATAIGEIIVPRLP